MKLLPIVTLAGALVTASAALAAMTPQEEAAFRQHCTSDYMRLCSQFDPGSTEVEQCFREKNKELSPRCSATIANWSKVNPKGRR